MEAKKTYQYNSTIIGTYEFIANLRDDDLIWYLKKAGIVDGKIDAELEKIHKLISTYEIQKKWITTFKNKKFRLTEIKYNQYNNIVESIKYEII